MSTAPATISKSDFTNIIARLRAKKAEEEKAKLDALALSQAFTHTELVQAVQETVGVQEDQTHIQSTDKYGNIITYNEKQSDAVHRVGRGESCIIIGAAGTGKTTCMKGGVKELIANPHTRILQGHDHKHLPHGVPGIVVCAYTRRATNNIRRNMTDDMKDNCITIHKLLEYGPVYYEVTDPESGKTKITMRFEPFRHAMNPLPHGVSCIIFEESSMIATSLYAEVIAAAPPDCQFVFLGDIQQLPPVFGAAILGFKMLELPVVELTEVYRQALESPIIRLAHRILSGKEIGLTELTSEWNVPGQLKLAPWMKPIEWELALGVVEKLFIKLYNDGSYDPESDMILMPFNKSFGTIELNRTIANQIARKRQSVTWEVVAGFLKHYFSVGDKVLFDREDALILDISINPAYTGVQPQAESIYLDYWGHNATPSGTVTDKRKLSESGEDIDFLLAQVSATEGEDTRVAQCSHHIKIKLLDSDTERTLTTAAEVNAMILGYALTVHKSQGSEWDKVFCVFHNKHAVMMQRELLYTAVTRAKKELIVICEPDTFTKAIQRQRIKGNTLEEKAEFFKGKIDRQEEQS
jgi:exodeoxyribonuclease V alpha subunit